MLHPFITLIFIVLIVDAIYLYIVSNVWQRTVLKIQQSPLQLNLVYTMCSYLCVCVGLYFFVWQPFHTDLSKLKKFSLLFGFVLYGVFNFTNAAILADYPIRVIVQDTLWGSALSFFVMMSMHYIYSFSPIA